MGEPCDSRGGIIAVLARRYQGAFTVWTRDRLQRDWRRGILSPDIAGDGDKMACKLLLAALAAVALSGCGSMGCGASANNQNSGGACGTHVTFLR